MSQKYSSSDYPEEDIEWIIPAKAGYKDRKMAKWEGFILSDHTEMIQALDKHRKKKRPPKEKQSARTVSDHLKRAFETKQPVAIQMDFIRNGEYEEDIVGVISGFENGQIHIQTEDDFVAIEFELIRNVAFPETMKWYDRPPS